MVLMRVNTLSPRDALLNDLLQLSEVTGTERKVNATWRELRCSRARERERSEDMKWPFPAQTWEIALTTITKYIQRRQKRTPQYTLMTHIHKEKTRATVDYDVVHPCAYTYTTSPLQNIVGTKAHTHTVTTGSVLRHQNRQCVLWGNFRWKPSRAINSYYFTCTIISFALDDTGAKVTTTTRRLVYCVLPPLCCVPVRICSYGSGSSGAVGDKEVVQK